MQARILSTFARAAVVAALITLPIAAAAQTALPTADAGPFIGTWTLTLESPQGAFSQKLILKDDSGKVAGEISNDFTPTPTAITDISKAGEDLVMKFAGDFQGQAFTAKITMTPDGTDKANITFDVMDGAFVMTGTGAKQQ